MESGMLKFPKVIEIQFHNQCNANCIVCPYKDMKYKKTTMPDDMFERFIDQIPNENLVRIIPYLNNEPFLDRTYVAKLQKIRRKCPDTEIEVSTNVSMLNEEIIKSLKELNLTELRLSVFGYSDDTYHRMMPGLNKERVFQNLSFISEILGDSNTIISIVMIDDGSIEEREFVQMECFSQKMKFKFERWGFLDRSKNVRYKTNQFYNDSVFGCEQRRPVERLHILANGDVIFCCQDWSHSLVIGNIGCESIQKIWNSDRYNALRKRLYEKTIEAPELCKNCKLALYE